MVLLKDHIRMDVMATSVINSEWLRQSIRSRLSEHIVRRLECYIQLALGFHNLVCLWVGNLNNAVQCSLLVWSFTGISLFCPIFCSYGYINRLINSPFLCLTAWFCCLILFLVLKKFRKFTIRRKCIQNMLYWLLDKSLLILHPLDMSSCLNPNFL